MRPFLLSHSYISYYYTTILSDSQPCAVVGAANRDGGKAGREEEGVTVTRRAMLQRWRLVRMGDGWGRARIGASPYDPCSLRGRLCGEGV